MDVAQALGLADSYAGVDLDGVGFDSPLRYNVAKQLVYRHPEHALVRVQLDFVPPQVCEGLSEIGKEVILSIRLDDDVVDVDVSVVVDVTTAGATGGRARVE